MLELPTITALTFDCYGTLIDWESGIEAALRPVLSVFSPELTREVLLEDYARFEAECEAGDWRPYREVLLDVTRKLYVEYGVPPGAAPDELLLDSLPHWQPFEDTPEALQRLAAHVPLGIVSNIDDDLLTPTRKLLAVGGNDPFTWQVTSEQVKAYKPAPAMFEAARESLGPAAVGWLHAAQSVFHDVVPARELGLSTALITRRGTGATPEVPNNEDSQPDLVLPDLAALADAFDAARS